MSSTKPNAPATCQFARETLLRFRQGPHNDSVLKMALDGMIEIEDGILENADAETAARHVASCPSCAEWLDEFYPDRAAQREKIARQSAIYCCSSMRHAVCDPDTQTRFSFILFRGEDACWRINDDLCFARHCPWCGSALPDGPFENDGDD